MEKEILRKTAELNINNGQKKQCVIEYYLLNKEKNYGLKVVKKERLKDGSIKYIESYFKNNVSSEEDKADRLINLLARNRVTPVSVGNVLEDMEV